MNATSDAYFFLAGTGLMAASAHEGRNFAGSPSAAHSFSKPDTKKVCASFPILTMCPMSGRYVLLNHWASWYHIAFCLPSMIEETVSGASAWHLERNTKSALKRLAWASAQRWVSFH